MNRATRGLTHPRLLASLAGLLGLLSLAGGRVEVRAEEDKDKPPAVVKVEVTADKPDADGRQVLTVTLEIDPDWNVFANPVEARLNQGKDNEFDKAFETQRTQIEVKRDGKPLEAKFDYPRGKLTTVKDFGSYRSYETKVSIKGTVQRARGDTAPLTVSVSFQANNEKRGVCLVPAVVERKVP
jgi:hypothetical protein